MNILNDYACLSVVNGDHWCEIGIRDNHGLNYVYF